MVRLIYNTGAFMKNDFFRPLGAYDFHFISGAPNPTPSYLTIFLPFDQYVWISTLMSVIAVNVTLIGIDKIHAKWTNTISSSIIYHGKTFATIAITRLLPFVILHVCFQLLLFLLE